MRAGTYQFNSIGSVSNPDIKPETASALEFAYGHRFSSQTIVQADVYQAYEQNALFGANLPATALGTINIPPTLLSQYLQRISSFCNSHATLANLAVSTTYNAASARYRGIELSADIGLTINLLFMADYDIRSAAFLNLPDNILAANTTIINGAQIPGIPLRKGNVGLEYTDRCGLDVAMIGNYIGNNIVWTGRRTGLRI